MTRRLLALAVACGVLVCLLYVVFVRTRSGQRIDDAALDGRADLTSEEVQDADDLLQTVSLTSVALLGGAIVVAGVARGRWELAGAAALVLVGANVVTQAMKEVLPRPDLLPGQAELGIGNSLPSGHTTVAASIALAAVLVSPPRLRGAVAVLGALYTAAVGVATLTAGWHRPSDAVAGVAMATGWAAAAAGVLVAESPSRRVEIESGRTILSPLLVAAGAILVAASFGGLVLGLLALRLGRLDAVDLGRAYAGGAIAIAGAALLLTGALLLALRVDRRSVAAPVR